MQFLASHQERNETRPPEDAGAAVDSRRRMHWAGLAFVVGCGLVMARIVSLEVHQGDAFRNEATKPQERRLYPAGMRGRIISSDGVVLAVDRPSQSLAMEYRRLQQPLDEAWLRRMARAKLTRSERRDSARVAQSEAQIRVELAELHRRLAELCRLSPAEWDRRRARIERQVTQISQRVNERREAREVARVEADRLQTPEPAQAVRSWFGRLTEHAWKLLTPDDDRAPSAPIIVAEELDYHVLVDDLSESMVAEIVAHPTLYPGVRIEQCMRRVYPGKHLASQLAGHLGVISPEEVDAASHAAFPHEYHVKDRVGRLGLESYYETILRGTRGTSVELLDHAGRVMSTKRESAPLSGQDLVLSLDAALQETAERLLDGALARRPRELSNTGQAKSPIGGGAVLALDVENGAVLVAATAPRFDPNLFSDGTASQVELLLADTSHPLFDRATKMAIAPGSVFEVVSAMALLAEPNFDAQEPFDCHGYWRQPDQRRCSIYAREQVGHGRMTLGDALAQDCNVYFFHHAAALGPPRLIEWALRLGFGRTTGIDLAGESPGSLPTPANIRDLEGHAWRLGDTQSLAVGQGSLTVTPLQMARVMAALANGGRLVTPHLVSELKGGTADGSGQAMAATLAKFQPLRDSSPTIPGLERGILQQLRDALLVSAESWQNDEVPAAEDLAGMIAGKAGTAETGSGRPSHAWFAGYAPVDHPRVAFVVVLEHAGDEQLGACPVAKRLAMRMRQLGYFDPDGRSRRENVTVAEGTGAHVE